MKTLTINDLPRLRPGQILHHTSAKNADKTPLRARVNGKLSILKRTNSFRLPMKHGLYDYFYITETNLHEWTMQKSEESQHDQ